MAHGSLGQGSDVLEGQGQGLTGLNLNFSLVVFHLVIAGDGDLDISFGCTGFFFGPGAWDA